MCTARYIRNPDKISTFLINRESPGTQNRNLSTKFQGHFSLIAHYRRLEKRSSLSLGALYPFFRKQFVPAHMSYTRSAFSSASFCCLSNSLILISRASARACLLAANLASALNKRCNENNNIYACDSQVTLAMFKTHVVLGRASYHW